MYKRLLMSVLVIFIPWQLQAAETPPVIEIFDCNYNSGQDRDDLDKAVDFWQAKMANVEGSENYFAALFSPIRATSDFDIHWVGGNANLNEWAANVNRFIGSDEGQAAQDRFDKVLTCETNLFSSKEIYIGDPPQPDDTFAVAEAYGCNLRTGKTMLNAGAIESSFATIAKEMGSKVNVYRWAPLVANVEWDVIYIIGHDDLSAFAENNTAQFNSPALNLHGALLASVMECKGGLYGVDILQAPPAPM
jgi:hypothetical protein